MCDRLCMTFSLKELQAIIQLRDQTNATGPNYVELGTKLRPVQTYNASSTSPCPVLLSEKHIYSGISSSSIVLAIMQWGLSPSWEGEGPARLKYRITHAKSESLTKTKTFEVTQTPSTDMHPSTTSRLSHIDSLGEWPTLCVSLRRILSVRDLAEQAR